MNIAKERVHLIRLSKSMVQSIRVGETLYNLPFIAFFVFQGSEKVLNYPDFCQGKLIEPFPYLQLSSFLLTARLSLTIRQKTANTLRQSHRFPNKKCHSQAGSQVKNTSGTPTLRASLSRSSPSSKYEFPHQDVTEG